MNKKNSYGDFGGVDVGMPVEERWVYPTIGYNSSDGIIYLGDDQVQTIPGMTLLAMRQCKEVEDASGIIHRYPLRTRKALMVDGDFSSRWQGIVYVDGDLYVFGARSWTARAAFMNPGGGPYSDEKFPRGIWHDLMDHVKDVSKATGKNLPPLCWKFDLSVEDNTITVGTGKNTSKSHRLVRISDFIFVGAETANMLAALYKSENLQEWVEEWNKTATEQPQEEEAVDISDLVDDIPF